MSPRAAARLEAIGFDQVFDYVGGKKDWLAANLPTEGERSQETRSGAVMRTDPPTCRPEETIDGINRSDLERWGLCVVTGIDNVVHGLLTPDNTSDVDPQMRAEDVMQLGPTTIRPSRSIESALNRMDQTGTNSLLVTTESGELIGVLFREDAEHHVD